MFIRICHVSAEVCVWVYATKNDTCKKVETQENFSLGIYNFEIIKNERLYIIFILFIQRFTNKFVIVAAIYQHKNTIN